VDQIERGNTLVGAAGSTMQEIVASVQHVAGIMNEITVASRKQSAGIDQVNLAINQMDAVTQSNAMLVEHASAAAASLRNQALRQAQAVAAFKLEHATASMPQVDTDAEIAMPGRTAPNSLPIGKPALLHGRSANAENLYEDFERGRLA
jgi:methyl-accepting chemotaxis protein